MEPDQLMFGGICVMSCSVVEIQGYKPRKWQITICLWVGQSQMISCFLRCQIRVAPPRDPTGREWCTTGRANQKIQHFVRPVWEVGSDSPRTCLRSWLVVSTHLKDISQLGWLFPIYGKIKNVPNHQPGRISEPHDIFTFSGHHFPISQL